MSSDRSFFGHPLSLANLAGIEMWERFSFYGMQALLAYYVYFTVSDGGLGYSKAAATSIVGAYGGLVYLSAVLGAWVADRVFGSERTLFGAANLIMFGHISLALIPGMPGLTLGLVCIALGSGTLKATTSSVLGDMYAVDDNRRDGGFSIYYMAVNIGAFAGPLLTGALQTSYGFHWGFAAAALGMLAGIIQYALLRRKTLAGVGLEIPKPLNSRERIAYPAGAAAVVLLIIVLFAVGVLTMENLSTVVSFTIGLAAIILVTVILTSKDITRDERDRVVSFIPMFLASTAFWSLFQQQSTMLAIYAEKRLDRTVFGWEFPESWVQSINPVFIILFAGVFASLWSRLGDRQPTTPLKFALGLVIMGCAFLFFLLFVGTELTPLWGIVAILFLFTMAELLLSPVGQSLSTKLAPRAFHTQMVALFFLSVSLGSSLAGTFATFYDPTQPSAERSYFLTLGVASILIGLLMAALSRWILSRMHGIR